MESSQTMPAQRAATTDVEARQTKLRAEIEEARTVLSEEALGLLTPRPTESLADIVKDVVREIEYLKKEIKELVDEPAVEIIMCECECSECGCDY